MQIVVVVINLFTEWPTVVEIGNGWEFEIVTVKVRELVKNQGSMLVMKNVMSFALIFGPIRRSLAAGFASHCR